MIILLISLFLAVPGWGQNGSANPHGLLKWDCQSCHSTESWKKIKDPLDFKHQDTGFLLSGSHKFANCASCHNSLKFAETATACADCHTDVHRGQFGADCQNCHTPADWQNQQEILQMHASRGFPLTGVHAIADCQSCHTNDQYNEFAGTSPDCNSCHLGDFSLTENPDHARANFAVNCESCHRPTAFKWEDTNYRHPEVFELRGAHVQADCNSCHVSAYFGTSPECYSCHSGEFESTTSPPHVTLGFAQDCAICHTEARWEGGQFDHIQASGFELRGAHTTASCNDCHVNNQFAGLPRDCIGCHQDDFMATTSPNHVQGQFPGDCMICHNENAWQPADFDHNLSAFPLTGAHQILTCESCHEGGQFTALPTDCFSCHEGDFNNVSDPSHVQNNFSQDCMQCHNTGAWTPATFDHGQTQFPLTGAHIPLNCIDCHSQGYTATPTDCYSCHENDFTAVNDPNHVQNNFSQDCTQCHSTSAWTPATFDHGQTQFPLTGAHIPLNCIDCHSQGYANTPTDCYSCHENDFNNVNDPNHVQNNFSQDCTQCHSTGAWTPATFDHSQTQFPLTGAHLVLQCIDCHSGGYSGTPTDCFACHQDDYNTAVNPNHLAAGFPTNCQECHNTSNWNQTTWNHDFPIYSGKHQGEWQVCADCHVNPSNYAVFECIFCHEHNQPDMDDKHQGVSGYVYLSSACYDCHPDGEKKFSMPRKWR